MSLSKSFKRLVIPWFAILSIALGSFAPLISQAIALDKTSNLQTMEICTSSGMQAVHLNQDDSSPTNNMQSSCPYCLAHTYFVPSTNSLLTFALPLTNTFYPPLFYQSASRQFAWVKLPAQAPPLH
ncbi:DUF2946 domain-containing protein [Polynucleobacter rarus]|uniref:DUF2946 domain-containing protein n=1 Tax=Polynucleobacter rarus TaxID=556055 RepID=UPI000D3ED97B|nr:DUF2946 domain-containing protein [Polynucleobacter rarus]